MYLLNAATLRLESFAENETPPYAILSHTWGKEEVSFQEMQRLALHPSETTSDRVNKKDGLKKIEGACKISRLHTLNYIWIDTCCIDKSSSAELSEAINSMYMWYRRARVCFTYLSDVLDNEDNERSKSSFASSRWFTRGWTLQELIASPSLIFYSRGWHKIGTKETLKHEISRVTGVDVSVLDLSVLPRSISVAKRMFWASNRNTTRMEDVAYCLMGLFEVNMPLLYGEGRKSFFRLQEEIMRNSEDHSLFAWRIPNNSQNYDWLSMLAPSPKYFSQSQNVVPISSISRHEPHTVTNRGLRIELALFRIPGSALFIAPLDCTDSTACLGPEIITLAKVESQNDEGMDQFMRVDKDYPLHMPGLSPWQKSSSTVSFGREDQRYPYPFLGKETIYVLQDVSFQNRRTKPHPNMVYAFHIRQSPDPGVYQIMDTVPQENWNPDTKTISLKDSSIGVAGTILFANSKDKSFILSIGVDIHHFVTVRLHFPRKFEQWTEVHDGNKRLLDRDVARFYGKNKNPEPVEVFGPEPVEMFGTDVIAVEKSDSLAFTEIARIEDPDGVVIEAKVKQEKIGGTEMFVVDIVTKNDYTI